jgi:hypothetical protein
MGKVIIFGMLRKNHDVMSFRELLENRKTAGNITRRQESP